jgi:UDP-N-acetyl-D-glucosamine dehydrogenase
MDAYTQLTQRLTTGNAVVAVIGLGYVGLPLAAAMHQAGYRVLGLDTDAAKIDALRDGRNYVRHLGDDLTAALARSGRFEPTGDFLRLAEADAVIICVPTPLGPHQEPDLSYVLDSARSVGRTLRSGQLVVLESTTYPGTTRDQMLPALLAARPRGAEPLSCGRDFFVAFSPEREDPGRKSHTTKTIPKLVGGVDRPSGELASLLYRRAVEKVVTVSAAEVAEAAKILENVFRAVNIALVNELKMIFTPMDIDIWEVLDAAATKPFGFMPFFPGPGLGGHCIPIDPYYLTWKAREVGRPTRFIELAGEINTSMPHYVVDRAVAALNEDAKPMKNSRILVVGLAYKPNVDDVRETPAAEIIDLLADQGAVVSYHDPLVPVFPPMRRHKKEMRSVPLSPAVLAEQDCVIIVTHHDAIDWSTLADHASLVVDTRNVMKGLTGRMARIVKA